MHWLEASSAVRRTALRWLLASRFGAIGDAASFDPVTSRITGHERIFLGKGVFIGPYALVSAGATVSIGDDTVIGPGFTLMTGDHVHSLPGSSYRELTDGYNLPVVIGRNVWIGARVIILKGVSIGDAAIIGAGAVVTNDIPAFAVAVGNPAQVKRWRFDGPARAQHEAFIETQLCQPGPPALYRSEGHASSNSQNISRILEMVLGVQPQSVLDIGVGTGKMGFLLREYLDVYGGDGRTWPPPRRVMIEGIEAYGRYLSDFHRSVYDRILVGDADQVLPTIERGRYDLVMMIDVLEHLEPDKAERVVGEATRVGRRLLCVSPAGLRPQGASYGNPYERHRMCVTRRGLRDLGFVAVQRRNGSYFATVPSLRTSALKWRLEYQGRNGMWRLPELVRGPVRAVVRRLVKE